MYTDCIYESRNDKRKQYGIGRFFDFIKNHAGLGVDDLIKALLEDFNQFVGHVLLEDDLTLIGIEYRDHSVK